MNLPCSAVLAIYALVDQAAGYKPLDHLADARPVRTNQFGDAPLIHPGKIIDTGKGLILPGVKYRTIVGICEKREADLMEAARERERNPVGYDAVGR